MLKLISSLKSNAIAVMSGLIGFLYLALKLSRRKNLKSKEHLDSALRSIAAQTGAKEAVDEIRDSVETQIDENTAAKEERNEIPSNVRRSGRFGTSKRLF